MHFPRLILPVLAAVAATTASVPVQAERLTDESTIEIKGEARRYYRLHDTGPAAKAPVILLVSGSGCGDFGARFASFFESYAGSLDVYFLEKPHIDKGATGQPGTCSEAYNRADNLSRRVSDTLEFLEKQPRLKAQAERSVAILGFSEGGQVAPVVAAQNRKIGWLAVAGSGGMKQSDEFLVFADRGVAPYANPYSRQKLEAEFSEIAKYPDSQEKEFFGHPYAYWSSHLFHDPLPSFAALDIPIVAAMGEKDDSVPIESGRYLQSYFARHPQKNFQFVEYRNASHGLQADGKSNAKVFVANLEQWFKGNPQAFRQP